MERQRLSRSVVPIGVGVFERETSFDAPFFIKDTLSNIVFFLIPPDTLPRHLCRLIRTQALMQGKRRRG